MRSSPALGFLMLCFVSMYGFVGCSHEIDAVDTAMSSRSILLGEASIVPPRCAPSTDALLFTVAVEDREGTCEVSEVRVVEMLESLGSYRLYDDGGTMDVDPAKSGFQGSGDLIASDGIYSSLGRAPDTTGTFIFTFAAKDERGVSSPAVTRTLIVE